MKPLIGLIGAALLCATVIAKAVEIHEGETGYIANSSMWFTDEPDLAVWKRVRQAFAPKNVETYRGIILKERRAWQFIAGPLKVKVIGYDAARREMQVKMLAAGRLAGTEWWVEDKDYSKTK